MNAASLRRYIVIASLPLLELLALHLIGRVEFYRDYEYDWRYGLLHPWAIGVLSVSPAFLLWYYAMESEEKFAAIFSPIAYAASLVFFGVALMLYRYPIPSMLVAMASAFAGLFVFVDFKECISRAKRWPRAALIGLLAASASILYKLSLIFLWEKICRSTAFVVYAILKAAGLEVGIFFSERNPLRGPSEEMVHVVSPYVHIYINSGCSGLEGIFLFFFLLSSVLLLDWQLFKKWRLLEMYLIGLIYMFLINALRIASLFLMTHWSRQPDATPVAKLLSSDMLDMFHSYMGWVYYLAAFAVFILCVYRIAGKQVQAAK